MHYYMSLGNKWSSKDGVAHSMFMHTKAYYLSLMGLKPIKANFGKAKGLNWLLLFLLLCLLFRGTILAWPRWPQVARPWEEVSLVEGNLSAVYNHLGKEVICSEGIDHAPGESGRDLHFSVPRTLENQTFSHHLWLSLYPSVCCEFSRPYDFVTLWYATCF